MHSKFIYLFIPSEIYDNYSDGNVVLQLYMLGHARAYGHHSAATKSRL